MVSVSTLLKHLPPYQENELIIERDQGVHDIIREVMDAHKVFASDYDEIQQFFTGDAKELFDFCKRNISYEIEPEEDQTTRSPAATLSIGHGDCKHYAGFIAGVLDAINRAGGNINWRYRFASYDIFNDTPGHVFVIVKDKGQEIWIDPVLKSFNERLQPTYTTDKKVIGMLTRLSGIGAEGSDYRDYPVPALAANAEDPKLYAAIELLLNRGIMNADGTINVDSYDTLAKGFSSSADYNQIVDAFGIANDAALNGLGESIVHAIAKVSMFVPRSAYLSLVALNVFGLASKLYHCIYKDDTATTYYQPGQDKIYHAWYLAGGDWDKLNAAVKTGHTKKAILSGFDHVQAVGVAPLVPVWVASATAIIAALGAAISQILKDRGATTGVNYNIDPATGLPYGQQPTGLPGSLPGAVSPFSDPIGWIRQNPIIAAALGFGVYYFIKHRRA